MDKEFFLRHIKQKKDIYGEIFKYSRCFDINNNINGKVPFVIYQFF